MKKFVIKSIIFIIFFIFYFILINVIYIGIIASTDFNFIKRLESLKFDNPDYYLLVLGASLPQNGIDTELLTSHGIKSYNTSIDGSSVKTNYIQLYEYLTKYSKKPKYIILGLNSALIKSFDDEVIHPIVEVTMEDHKYTINDVPILKFKWLGFEFFKKIVSNKHRKARLSYGQLKFQKNITDDTKMNKSDLDIQKFVSSYWIGEIARLCTIKDIKLIILEMPGYRITRNISNIGPYKLRFNNGYTAMFYNFNSENFCEIFDAHEDWIGNSHLNEYGAVKFTNKLIDIVKKNI